MPPDEPNDEEELEELPDDYDTPFSLPSDAREDSTGSEDSAFHATGTLDSTHPATDTNIEPEELYDEGVSGAAEASEPNAGDMVTEYHPPEKQKKGGNKNYGDDEAA